MATQQKKRSRGGSQSRSGGSRNGRSASQKPEKYRFAQNVGGEATVPEREYRSYATGDGADTGQEPDVLLDVPVVKVDSIHLQVEDLDAHVSLKAKVLDLVTLNVGVYAHLGKVRLDIKGVEAQALLKVRLDHVTAIVDRVLTTLDRNPELLKSLGRAVEDVGSGAGEALSDTGEAVEEVGEGAEGAVKQVGQGAGDAVGEIGEGAGQAVEDVGEGAGQAVEDVGGGAGQAVGEVGEGAGQAVGDVGQGAGQAVGDVGEGAGQAVGNLDQTVGNVGEAAGQTVGQVGEGVGQAAEGVGGAAGQLAGVAGGLTGGGGDGGGQGQNGNGGSNGAGGGIPGVGGPGQVAKLAAKAVAQEIGSAASDEAKELGLAATRKVKALGERRRQRLAEKHHATPAAMRLAEELGVRLREIEGTGADGRITVGDVREASDG